MNKSMVGIFILSLNALQYSFAAKPLVEWVNTPSAVHTPPQNQIFLYYTLHNNTPINLPLKYSLSSPRASIAPNQSTCKSNILPAAGNCTIAVHYGATEVSTTEPLTIKIYYQGRGPLVATSAITVNKALACSLIKKAQWQTPFCQTQYQNALRNTEHVFNTSNKNVKQEQTLGGIFGIYQHTTTGEQICYISCGQRAIDGTPPDENTLFELASVSKLFTATVLGTLAYTRQINPLSAIISYLPSNTWNGRFFNLTPNQSSLTFQQLATFSGGVCFSDAPAVDPTGVNQVLNQSNFVRNINELDTSLASCINQGAKQVKLVYEAPHYLPSFNHYSNSSIGLLAQALMAIDGYPNVLEGDFNGWLCNNITNVLNMPMTSGCLPAEAKNGSCPAITAHATTPCNRALWQKGEYASGYHINNTQYQLGNPFKYLPWAGAGGIRSNARDMIQFIRANLNISSSHQSPKQLALQQGMQIAHTANNYLPVPQGSTVQANIGSQTPLKGGQGYAWVCDVIKGINICGKIGGHKNFRSFIGISKQQQYGLIILFNTGAITTNGGLTKTAATIPTISSIGVNMILNSSSR